MADMVFVAITWVKGMISVSPTWSNTKLYRIQINHTDSHKTPDSKYYLPCIKQMFVSKATISPNWLTLCCIDSNASLCSLMNDKCLEESSVNGQPPLQHANYIKIPSANTDKLIFMTGRWVDNTPIDSLSKFNVVSSSLLWMVICLIIYSFGQHLLRSSFSTGTVLDFRNISMNKDMVSYLKKCTVRKWRLDW